MTASRSNLSESQKPETWRWSFALVVAALLVVLAFLFIITGQSYQNFWNSLFIKPMHIPYGDLQSLAAAIECLEQGIDPLVTNPCDIGGRGLLLPRTWLSFAALGLSKSSVGFWAFLLVAQFLGALLFLFRSQKGSNLIWLALLSFGPPVLLAVERVNSDLLTFGCLVWAAALFSASERLRRWLALFLIFFATSLKLYPVVGGVIFFKGQNRESWRRLIFFFVLCAALFALTWDDIQAIRHVDTERHVYGVGHDMIWLHLAPIAEEWLTYDLLVDGWRLVEGIILAFLAVWLVRGKKVLMKLGRLIHQCNAFHVNTFILGSGIYIALFILHSFYDYKLVMILLTLPALLWVKDNTVDPDQRYWATGTLSLLVLLCWMGIYFWWTVYHQIGQVDLRTEPLLYYGSILLRFGISWGVFVGYVLGLASIFHYRWCIGDSVGDAEAPA